MTNRWSMLVALFLVRVTMAFQFQAVAALSPFIMTEFGVGLADIGLLIGLYLSPGIVIALPGGAIGGRFGDSRAVAFGLVLMIAGGLAMTVSSSWEVQLLGRLVAGIGGVILNVLMSKMVTDWFVGREIATAMGIFINSWPVGIAAALLMLPLLVEQSDLQVAFATVTALIVFGLVLLITAYRTPPAASLASASAPPTFPRGSVLLAVILAGSIWGLYNAALGMIFGFGPAMLTERGWHPVTASSTTSIVLWLVALSVPLGGLIADRLRRRNMVLTTGLVGFAGLMIVAAQTEAVFATFIALGLVGGIAAGPIMSLPSEVLQAEDRALGMGLFFTLFYASIVSAPIAAGLLSEMLGDASAAFALGAAMLGVCCVAFWLFRLVADRAKAEMVGS